jgi:hypothetical protein
MNEEAKKALEQILIKSEVELTPADIAFLKARSSYLTSEQISKYPNVLGEVEFKSGSIQTPMEVINEAAQVAETIANVPQENSQPVEAPQEADKLETVVVEENKEPVSPETPQQPATDDHNADPDWKQ